MKESPSARSDHPDSRPGSSDVALTFGLIGAAAAYAAVHLLSLPQSLEDIDSINFALGLRHFDVALHQPHPPGYPVYILLGRLALGFARFLRPEAAFASQATLALSLLSAAASGLAVACLGLFLSILDRLSGAVGSRWWALTLVAACPLFWVAGVRPMSDMVGLSLALLSLACTLRGRQTGSGAALVAGALTAAITAGVRVQTVLLTLPLLLLAAWERRANRQLLARVVSAIAVGGLAWVVPLVWLSGGIRGYLMALESQAGEDFSWVDMLVTDPTLRRLTLALVDSIISPWSMPALAGLVIVAAVAGVGVTVWRERRALVVVLLAFGPYALFHLLLQETSHIRYALPLVVPMAWLASRGLVPAGRPGRVLAAAAVVTSLVAGVPPTARYAREMHPAFRIIEDMARESSEAPPAGVFAHYALYRSLQVAAPASLGVVPPRRNQEWLAPIEYWRGGGRQPVWFLADPRRTDLELYDPRSVAEVLEYAWSGAGFAALGGTRPEGAVWYRLLPPAWMVDEGWSLTPEAGGRVHAGGGGPHRGPILADVKRHTAPVVILVGGYYLGDAQGPASTVALAIDGRTVDRWTHDHRAAGPAFLHVTRLESGMPAGQEDYARLRLTVTAAGGGQPGELAIRQFDVQPTSGTMHGFGAGWYEDELDPAQNRRWRWTSDHAELFVLAGTGATLRLRGESPLKYFGTAPLVRVAAGALMLAEFRPDTDFDWRIEIPAGALPSGGGTVTLSLDRVYLPGLAEGTADTRRLGLRIFETRLEEHVQSARLVIDTRAIGD
jgi:hypothetical protein